MKEAAGRFLCNIPEGPRVERSAAGRGGRAGEELVPGGAGADTGSSQHRSFPGRAGAPSVEEGEFCVGSR